jgi:hypothetical protein
VIEHVHESGDVGVVNSAVNETEGFPESMGAIITTEVYLITPSLDEGVKVRNAQNLSAIGI